MSPESSTTPRVVLVTGSGRSGTSTVSGALKRLGLYIPQPEVEADETNPRGFYESQWVVDFHKQLLNSIPVRTIDSRPEATELAARAGNDPAVQEVLREFLREQGSHPQILVKDPRAFWVHDLWRSVADDLGYDLSFVTMLRHPVEVAKSRDSAYLTEQTTEFRRLRETANIAAWCNAAFETEIATRANPRAFVRYTDLLADWRPALARAGEQAQLTFNADLSTTSHHDVDDFIDTKLYRSQVSWEQTDVPTDLQVTADRVWEAMNVLVDSPHDQRVIEELAVMREEYARIHDYAIAVALDHTRAREAHVRRNTKANMAQQHDKELASLRRELEIARSAGATRPVSLARRVVRGVRRRLG